MSNDTHETTGQRRLREAREAAAALESPMPIRPYDDANPRTAQPGEWMHSMDESGVAILRSVSMFGASSVTLYRGDEIEIDAAMLEADLDRHGRPGWAALLYDESAQIERWGSVRLRPGRAPRDLRPWTYGSVLWREMRERARREAHSLPTADERAAALRDVQVTYGDAPTTTTTLNAAPNASIPQAEEQQAQIRAGGVRAFQHVTAREYGDPEDRA